ncbi:MAG: aminodeoxychorismate synthase component I [Myxococcota bacterium]|nr:aminodeoxychorismate synthase component I [Myxococcota bacterium]
MGPRFATRVSVQEIAPRGADWQARVASLRGDAGFWLLDSALADDRLGRFSFAGAGPYLELRAWRDRAELLPRRPARPDVPDRCTSLRGAPLEILRSLLPPRCEPAAAALPFAGGAVGWLGYELGARAQGVDPRGVDDTGLPDLCLLFVDRLLAFEHATGRLLAVANGFDADPQRAADAAERAAQRLAERVACGEPDPFEAGVVAPPPGRPALSPSEPLRLRDAATGLELGAFFDADSYAKAVRQVKERIAAGDVYQANLTHRLALAEPGDPWDTWCALRRLNPAPFGAYLALPEVTVIGSSPERFLRIDGSGRLESRPIKGTRPRGASPEADEALRRALAASGKDRAENVMIVDLVRNDLGQVAEIGSVEVPELLRIEPYATVFQLVSTVTGRLRPDRDAVDAVRAAFPPGSMTGAPKIAAMQLLSALEPVRRGVYSGALGYLDVRGGLDLSVVIRTILNFPRRAHVHVGGGIVADSDPEAEWVESLDKARASLDALARSGGTA